MLAQKEKTMTIDQLNRRLHEHGIPTDVYNTGGDVMACRIITWEGEWLIQPSEVFEIEPGLMVGLYDREGNQIEWWDSVSLPHMANRICKE